MITMPYCVSATLQRHANFQPSFKQAARRRLHTLVKQCAALAILATSLIAAPASVAGSWQNSQSLGGFSSVNVYTPDSNSPIGAANKKSLLIVLHGCVQPISSYQGANLEAAAEAFGMVIAVPDAAHKEGYSCWAYWSDSTSGSPARNKRDYENLIELAQDMTADAGRHLDSDQVYIAGLSSGAAFANTTACLAPDVFAGMGISAGPSIGTTSNGALGPCESANVQARCNNYAGSNADHFATQIASIAQADDDATVSTCYNTQNSDGMAGVYGVSKFNGTNTISEGSKSATETLWQDGRVSMLWFHGGVGHAWSGGTGASGSYVSAAGINYAMYLGQYFTTHNKRVDRNAAPVINDLTLSLDGDAIVVSTHITDAETIVSSATAILTQAISGDSAGNLNLVATGDVFTGSSGALGDALYRVSVTAIDDEGAMSDSLSDTIRVGPEPTAQPPVLSNLSASVSGQCATVSGTVVDENQDLDTIIVSFSSGDVAANISSTDFNAQGCNLAGGDNSATITATDTGGLSNVTTIAFNVDAGQSATLDGHISQGRLNYTNYADCYLEYGTASFTLSESTLNAGTNSCHWQDDDASCVGPEISCSSNTGGGSGDGNPDDGGASSCEDFYAMNYNHKAYYGRAYSTGNALTPDYFAVGSNEAMSGSTYAYSTLRTNDNGTSWHVGACP